VTTDANDRTRAAIEEFRANEGRIGGNFEGVAVLLLHLHAADGAEERVVPLTCRPLEDGRWAIFASKGGAPGHPAWYADLLAHPEATIEFGTDTIEVAARVTQGEERERIWSAQKQARPQFADYEARTDREIPVLVLEPR